MAYVDSSGKTHVSLSEASRGHAAQTTASRNTAGQVVGSSSGSNYVREQEAARAAEQESVRNSIQYNTGMPSWATAPGETAGIDRSQLQQFRTVDQINEEREQGTISRTLSAFKQGYRAGEGKDYSLEGLKAPTVQAKDMITYSLYEKTNKLSERYDSVQNAALSKLPSGTFRDVVTGVTNVPEMAIGAAGGIPLGLETIARNPSSISDSISFGLGAMSGATVQKAQTHPGELAGELVGSWALAKGGSSLSRNIKPSLSSQGLKEFSLSERASLGAGRTQPLNTNNPLRQAATQKQQLMFKEHSLVEPKTQTYVFAHGRLYPETQLPKTTVVDIMESGTAMKGARGKASVRASARTRTQRHSQQPPLQEKTEPVLSTKIEEPTMQISSIRAADSLTPEVEQVIFSKSSAKTSNVGIDVSRLDAALKRDIFSPELTAPTDYVISSIQAPKVAINTVKAVEVGRAQGVLIPSLAYSVPFAGQALSIQGKQINEASFMAASLPVVSLSSSSAGMQSLPEPTLQKEQGINALYTPPLQDINPMESQKTDPVIIPDLLPNVPALPDSLPGGSPGEFTPFPFSPFPKSKKPVFALDDSIDVFSESSKPKRRKTKHKQTKNTYGDPFKIKL